MTVARNRSFRIRRGGTAIVVALGLMVGASACGKSNGGNRQAGSKPNGVTPSSPAAVPPGHSPAVSVNTGPKPPDQGAWLGAWVRPQNATPAGRAEAFANFERLTNAQLTIAHMYHEWTEEFPGAPEEALGTEADLLMISWQGTDTRSTAMGIYDNLIRQRAEKIKQYARPLLIRYRWEMDRPNLAASVHSPEDYIAAWRHVRGIFTEVGATNAGFVWCPHVQGFVEKDRNAAAYYPGDDQVDWLCADVYAGPNFDSFTSQMNMFMSFASKIPRPILVGEFGVTDRGSPEQAAAWLRDVKRYTMDHPQVRALVYFAAKQDRKPVYDTTLADGGPDLTAFREMAEDPYFRQPPPPLLGAR